MAEIDQGTVDAAIDPYASQIGARIKRRDTFAEQATEFGKKEVAESEKLAGQLEERGKAGAAAREALSERIATRPSARVNEEAIPAYTARRGTTRKWSRACRRSRS